ncbi:MAG: ornithine cyclodeaminase family protein [Chloroflexi bacterium]|nr:ornithine cyclodeaminase family protein [Chloroflexota bacterium]
MPTTTDALPFLSGDEIRRAVSMADVLDAVEAAYRDVASGRDRSPQRIHLPVESGDLLVMPGIRVGATGFSVKLVTVVAENRARGLPTLQAVVVWFDGATGRPMAVIDGPTLTAMRTGAASGVATRLLARHDASVAALIGVGAQAEWQLRAVLAARPIRRLLVYARTPAAREAFAAGMAAEVGVEVVPVQSAEEAVRPADVVCCATTSSMPVFEAAWLGDGAHVNGVGAFRLGMVELPPELFERAALVAVDSREAAMAEAGDIVAAIEAGLLRPDALVEIGSVEPSWVDSRPAGAVTAFKSVGLAIQDVATAELIVSRLL